jgi:hypothetical protein
MRIGEEKDRRDREAEVLARLPRAFDELEGSLAECVNAFAAQFGSESARLHRDGLKLSATGAGGNVEVNPLPELPGIEIRRKESAREIKVGILPGDRVFYLDVLADQYLSMDELTRLILDRVLFPKLQE